LRYDRPVASLGATIGRAGMLHAQQMILFARVVDAGSFAAAAKLLGQTRAAVSKQIAALEDRIGAQLLQRTTRSMHLTEIGAEFYARCARILQEAEEAERAVASLQGAPRGLLRITAPRAAGVRPPLPRAAGRAVPGRSPRDRDRPRARRQARRPGARRVRRGDPHRRAHRFVALRAPPGRQRARGMRGARLLRARGPA